MPLHTTHRTAKIFLKNRRENRCSYNKLLKKIVAVVKKVVVFMADNCISSSVVCEGHKILGPLCHFPVDFGQEYDQQDQN